VPNKNIGSNSQRLSINPSKSNAVSDFTQSAIKGAFGVATGLVPGSKTILNPISDFTQSTVKSAINLGSSLKR
jgi:hypothetical protein